MNRKFLLTVSFFLIVALSSAQYNTISLYEQCNYAGKKYNLAPGNYWTYQMKIKNDKLASFKVPSGMKVTLYEHDKFQGRSITYTSNMTCLPAEWIYNTSSMVVESQYGNNNNNTYNNDYVTFYNDCYSKGYSQSLKPGSYTSSQLGLLSRNISSFTIQGNLRVKIYINNDNLSGYSVIHDASVSCLGSSQNDKIASLVIEYKPYTPTYPDNNNNYNNNSDSYATVYTDCYYGGNSLRLGPGNYQGNKLGLLRYNISSIEIPNNLRAKVYINNENFSGVSYTLTENINCLSNNLNNKIASIVIEEKSGSNYNPYDPYNNQPANQGVIIFMDANYQGQSATVLPGTYATMAQAGFYNDAISSLRVPQGYRVVLYENENFKGKTYTLTADKNVFTLSGWNDRASSMAVYRD